MPAGPAIGRVGAQRRALTTASTAPASNTRWCRRTLWCDCVCADPREAVRVVTMRARGWRLGSVKETRSRHRPAGATFPPDEPAAQTRDMRHDQRWRERPRLGGLGSPATQETGVVHAIVGSATETWALGVTAAQSAASMCARGKLLRPSRLHDSPSWRYQG
jgi:hypothetical protein